MKLAADDRLVPRIGRIARQCREGEAVLLDRGRARQESIRIGVPRRVEDRWRVALLDDAARVQDEKPFADRRDDAEIVRNVDEGELTLVDEMAQQLEDLGLDRHVDCGRWIVRDEQAGLAGQGHGDGDTLLHAARQLTRECAEPPFRLGNTHLPQKLHTLSRGFGSGDREVRANYLAELDAHRIDRRQRRRGVLKDERHAAAANPPQLATPEVKDILVREHDPPRRDAPRRADDVEQRQRQDGLAAAALADHAEPLAGLAGQAHVVQRRELPATDPVDRGETLDAEQWVVHRRSVGSRW